MNKNTDRGKFIAQVIAWIKGMKSSELFDSQAALSGFSDEASIRVDSGESLKLKECVFENGFIIGAKHEIPDAEGRIWISEVTLNSTENITALRVKTQCTVEKSGARAQVPKKPYFIKLAIEDGWPIEDGEFTISQAPIEIDTRDIDFASKIIVGDTKCNLPIIYISKSDNGEAILKNREIDDLAFKLGGVAHVVVEPNRAFSKLLMLKSNGRNPYGGYIGICVSGHGVVKRYNFGSDVSSSADIIENIYDFSSNYVTNRKPRVGVEWQSLIEESVNLLRKKIDNGADELNEWLKEFDGKESEKDKTIRDLREQLEKLQENYIESSKKESSVGFDLISNIAGVEIYKGEFFDRIRSVLLRGMKIDNLHNRTAELCRRIVDKTSWSGGAQRLQDRLKTAGKDSANADQRISEILIEIGYEKRHSGGHPVLTPDAIFGLSSQTMSSSSSDHRAGKNAAQRIIRDLGLDSLKD